MKPLLTLSLLVFCLTCSAQKQNLQLRLALDSTYYLVTNANMTITQQIPGHPQVSTTILGGKISHKVTAVHDSVYEMQVEYRSLNMHMQLSGGKSINFSTDDNDDQNIFSKMMKSILHKPFNMTINRKGKVLAIKNIETLYDNLTDGFPQITPEQKTQIINQLKQSFGEESFKGNFQDAFAVYPDTLVGVNEQWVALTGLQSVVDAQIKTIYTLKSADNNNLMIHGDAEISSDTKPDFKQLRGMPVRFINIMGTATSDIELDKQTGWVKESRVAKLIKGTMEVKDNPQIPGGISFPMIIAADLTTADK